jgi:hypothetical protein
LSPNISEELRRRAIAPSGGAPCEGLYMRGHSGLSTTSGIKIPAPAAGLNALNYVALRRENFLRI